MTRRAHHLASIASMVLGIAAAAPLTACVDGGVDADIAPGDPAGDPITRPTPAGAPFAAAEVEAAATATYRVPLPAELAALDDLASFPLAGARASLDGERVTIGFMLPAGLLGVDTLVELDGVRRGDVAIVDGPLGAGTCRFTRELRCELVYRPLVYSVDLDAVARYWRGRGDAAIDERLIVSSLFDEDPLGVLAIPLD